MNGEGFTAHIKEGDKVKVGDPLITCDLELIKEKASSTVIPIVIMNGEAVGSMVPAGEKAARKGESKAPYNKSEISRAYALLFYSTV